MVGQSSPVESSRPQLGMVNSPASPEASRSNSFPNTQQTSYQFQQPRDTSTGSYSPGPNTASMGYSSAATANGGGAFQSHEAVSYMNGHGHATVQSPDIHRQSQRSNSVNYGVLSPVPTPHGDYIGQQSHTSQSTAAMPYVAPQNFPPFSLPPSDFSAASVPNTMRDSSHGFEPDTSGDYGDHGHNQDSNDMMLLDQIGAQPTTIPVFGEGFSNKSPYSSIPDDLVAYLFSTGTPDASPTMGHMLSGNQYSKYVI